MAALPIELHLLGTFTLEVNGLAVDGVPKPVQELLAHLAVAGSNGVDRVETATKIWPDVDDERGLFYLRRALSQLRSALGSQRERLQATGERRISLTLEACWCDLTLFEATSKRPTPKKLAEAIEAYLGMLLVGHRSEWVRNSRTRYHEIYCSFLCELATLTEADGNLGEAREWLIRASLADPIREETCLRLMRLLAKIGDYVGIVRALQRPALSSLRRLRGGWTASIANDD